MPQRQPTNAHQLRIGDFVLTTLLDAQMEASFGLVQSIPEEDARRLHAENRRPTPPRVTLNAFLLDTADHRGLIWTDIGKRPAITSCLRWLHCSYSELVRQ